ISCLHFVPGMLNSFIGSVGDLIRDRPHSLRCVVASGEALTSATVQRWYALCDVPLVNLYGPTEASIDVTLYPTSKTDTRVPIGCPIWNTDIFILDGSGQLQPIGIVGEIC